MSDLVKRLRGYQESWWETIQRLDMGESDNGIMTTIRFEQHDTFKKAADILEQQAERIKELEVRLSGKTGYCVQCEALSALCEKLREALQTAVDCRPIGTETMTEAREYKIHKALTLPDIATPILAERDAKTLEEAAKLVDACGYLSVEELHCMAQSLHATSPAPTEQAGRSSADSHS